MKKILVIEDEEDIRADIVKMLGYEGFEAVSAENGRSGVLMARKHLPDLILCDVMMPGLNGYQALARIRSHPSTATIPFIFLTARASKEDMRRGMRLGADDYLAKPFTVTELLDAIETRLKRQAVMTKQLDELRVRLGLIMPSEMRNALTGILGFSEFLLHPEALPSIEEIVQIGRVIHESGLTLQRLVENYMIYAELTLLETKPEATNSWLIHEELDLKQVVTLFAEHKAREYQRELDVQLKVPDISLSFSAKSLQKIIIELLDNAFKFSDPGTQVHVVSLLKENHLLLKVRDRGPGMNRHQIASVAEFGGFEEYWYEQQGPGMGLRIANLLADLHGGTLTIQSELGEGTTVTIIVKIALRHPEES
jgi:CheY-like chemotaxis protein/anti-sigma regulatory factor (Ser/Thr protein kinase)